MWIKFDFDSMSFYFSMKSHPQQEKPKPNQQAGSTGKLNQGTGRPNDAATKQPEPKSGKDDYLGLGDEIDPSQLLRYLDTSLSCSHDYLLIIGIMEGVLII